MFIFQDEVVLKLLTTLPLFISGLVYFLYGLNIYKINEHITKSIYLMMVSIIVLSGVYFTNPANHSVNEYIIMTSAFFLIASLFFVSSLTTLFIGALKNDDSTNLKD